MPKKKTILDLYTMKRKGEMVTWITAYDAPIAALAEAAGLDMLLAGDSMGMCVYGYDSTVPVTMEQCLDHTRAVRTGAPNTFVIGDMPFLSYQVSVEEAVRNAGRFLKEAGAHFLLLEAVTPEVTRLIHDHLRIPVYGIGCGLAVDGQTLIVSDLLGIFQAYTPKFVKKYAHLAEEIKHAFSEFCTEVRSGAFPGPEHVYNMVEGEADKLGELEREMFSAES